MRPLLVPLALVPASCVVVTTPTYQEVDDCPPNILSAEASPPANKVVRIELSTDGTRLADFAGSVTVRSCATAKPYKGRVFLDGRLYNEIVILPKGESTRDPTSVGVVLEGLAPGCHLIELVVSTDWVADLLFRTPFKQGDVDNIAWFIDIEAPGTAAHTLVGSPCE